MKNDIDIEGLLRASLAENAGRAPQPRLLVEQILADVDQPHPVRDIHRLSRPQWRTWALPLIAAGSVAAVVAALIASSQLHHHASLPPATSFTPTVSNPFTPAPGPSSASASASAPTPTPTPVPTSAPTQTTPSIVGPIGGPLPTAFKVVDVTFVSVNDGWALGEANCLSGPGTCTAIVRTTDGGQAWVGIPTPTNTQLTGNGCAYPSACIQHLRFADRLVGYAYGPNALFVTLDGGANWRKQDGGADALETRDGTAIRVIDDGGCPPACTYHVETASLGSTKWERGVLPGSYPGDGVTLVRSGHHAYIQTYGNPAGGAESARSVLFTSADDGATWVNRGEPCPQRGGGPAGTEVDGSAPAAAADASLTVLCTPRGASNGQFTATSTDGGVTFGNTGGSLPSPVDSVGAASASVLMASADVLYRSVDRGVTWHPVNGNPGASGAGAVNFLGFENASTGRWVTGNGSTIWTTTDAGATWKPYAFK